MELVKGKQAEAGEWKTAIVRGIDFGPLEGELEARIAFLTRDDGEASGEVAVLAVEQLLAVMERLHAKTASALVGQACLVRVVGADVVEVVHLFAKNAVGE